jgi:hypothetical protein
MIDLLLGLLTQFWPYIAIALGGLAWGVKQKRAGQLQERNANRAKEADAYEQHLKEIADAGRARSRIKDGDASDDGFRRD